MSNYKILSWRISSSLHKYLETCNGGKCCGDNVDKYLFKVENTLDYKSSKLISLKRERKM